MKLPARCKHNIRKPHEAPGCDPHRENLEKKSLLRGEKKARNTKIKGSYREQMSILDLGCRIDVLYQALAAQKASGREGKVQRSLNHLPVFGVEESMVCCHSFSRFTKTYFNRTAHSHTRGTSGQTALDGISETR